MNRPVIGITTSFEEDQQRLHLGYTRCVENAGGYPVIIPFMQEDDLVRYCVNQLDGLVM